MTSITGDNLWEGGSNASSLADSTSTNNSKSWPKSLGDNLWEGGSNASSPADSTSTYNSKSWTQLPRDN